MWNTKNPRQKASVLVCDVDRDATAALQGYLSRFLMQVIIAERPEQLFALLQHGNVDLVIIDWASPSFNGFTVVSEIRQQYGVPQIILSEQNSAADRVMGLEAGADDYVGKPFEPRELAARVNAVLRRRRDVPDVIRLVSSSDIVCFDGWELHRDARHLVSPSGLSIALSNAEFRLLTTFLQSPRRLCSRDQLMERARGRGIEVFERSIDLLVSRLRHKLVDDSDEPSIIKTIRGAGYLFDVQSVIGKTSRRA